MRDAARGRGHVRKQRRRMGFQRKTDGAVILDHMLADQHGGQAVILFPRRIEGDGEQRQVLLSAHPVQAPRRPQRVAPVKPQRAERVGVGEALNRGGRNAAAQPDIADGIIAASAPLRQPRQLFLAQPADLAQAQPHGMFGMNVRPHAFHGADAVFRPPAFPSSSLLSQSEKFTSGGRISTPCSPASRTISDGA